MHRQSFGSYQIIEERAVYRAVRWYIAQQGDGARVSLFVLRDASERVKRLAQMSFPQQLAAHRGLSTIVERGESDGALFFVEELLDGVSLEELLRVLRRQGRRLPVGPSLYIAAQLCAGLSQLESALCSEIFLAPRSIYLLRSGEVKLLRSAQLRALDERVEALDPARAPTPRSLYCTPEELRGEQSPTLVFVVGCILYEMLSGDYPFESLVALRSVEFTPLEEASYGIDAKLSDIVSHAMGRYADERYSSAVAMEQELRAYLGGLRYPLNRHDLGAFLALATYEGDAWYSSSQAIVQREIERIQQINWLRPDAETESLTAEARESLASLLDAHYAALQPYAVDEEFPPCAVEVVRSVEEANEWAQRELSVTITAEMFSRVKASRAARQRLFLVWSSARTFSEAKERAVKAAILASFPRFLDPIAAQLRAWWPNLEGAPTTKILTAHIEHLFVFGGSLPSPWEPFLQLWERGVWPVAIISSGLLVYLPVYRGDTLVLHPMGATEEANPPLLSLFE